MVILRLKKVLDGLLNWTISNYLSKTDKTESWLYLVFNQISTPNYNAYESIVDILTRDEKNSRKLATRLMFDPSRADCPTIHIHLPQEEPMGGNLIGMSSDIENLTEGIDSFTYNYRKFFSSNYDIIVTSNNQTEVLLIYELLKFLFVAGVDTLNYNFTKFNFSGKELLYDSTLMPDIFFRAFTVHLDDDINIPSVISQGSITDVNFDGYFVGSDVPPLDDYIIIFTVQSKGVPIFNAEISINDTVLTTDVDGNAEIHLNRQAYSYVITKTGYFDKNGSVNVRGIVQVIEVSVDLSRNETHPGGGSGQVQVNIDGEFAGFDSFTFNKDTEELSVKAVLLPTGYVPTRANEVISKKFYEDNLPEGTKDHSGLEKLGYVESGHTGFEPEGAAAQVLVDANTYTDKQFIKVNSLGIISGNVDIDLSLGSKIIATLSGLTTITFKASSLPPVGYEKYFVLQFTNIQTIVFPVGTKYTGSIAPVVLGTEYKFDCEIDSFGVLTINGALDFIG